MNPDEQKLCDDAVGFVKNNKNELVKQILYTSKAVSDVAPVAIFMAGSPGAGKTELAESFLHQATTDGVDIVFIDPDSFRSLMPGYVGDNAHIFQKAVSRLVNELYSVTIKQKKSFLLDGTMSSLDQARTNVERVINYGYEVYIFYIYQDPISAWKFTQAREKTEGRRIKKDTFITQFFSAHSTVDTIKQEFGKKVTVELIVKDAYQNIKDFVKNIDKIDNHIKHSYTKETLESMISDTYDKQN